MSPQRTILIASAFAIAIPIAWATVSSAAVGDTHGARSTQGSGFRDRWVQRGPYRIHAREQAGAGPAIVLMHGFPDNHHLYDRLAPHLRGPHPVGVHLLGLGESGQPQDHQCTFADHKD